MSPREQIYILTKFSLSGIIKFNLWNFMNLNELYEYDDGLLLNKKTGHIYCNLDRDGYVRVRKDGKEYRAHRLIWEMYKGPIPEGTLIDHIDGDSLNNRLENLRLATRQQNNANSVGKSKVGLPKGITQVQGRFRAKLYHKGTTYSLGTYTTVEEAKSAYDTRNSELNGEFAKA